MTSDRRSRHRRELVEVGIASRRVDSVGIPAVVVLKLWLSSCYRFYPDLNVNVIHGAQSRQRPGAQHSMLLVLVAAFGGTCLICYYQAILLDPVSSSCV